MKIRNEPLPTIDVPAVERHERALILATLTAAEGCLRDARAHLDQLYAGTHVDARHLVNALAATRQARTDLDTAIHAGVTLARDLAVPWSGIGGALGTSRENAYQRFGAGRA